MDKEAAEIIAAALNNIAASTALQAETNVVLADKLDEFKRTVQGAQARVDRHLKPLIDRTKANSAKIIAEIEERSRRVPQP
jgi:hypothetical protein